MLRVVALSGGYSREVANQKLARNPGVIASFSGSPGIDVGRLERDRVMIGG